ncbi:hypothetical protein BOKEGFJH_00125 [Chlamydia avium]|uniref:preprotein translocase subunit SecG n=1 Tax=Chlamydia avium TaxID=1457141 RepID=UPI00055705BA|nr:preprotein translocase subunit SecG [Chlamydia avium]VVT42615.1 hypothetical protein BOKEGFJH_00125 [Chlamydia avium]
MVGLFYTFLFFFLILCVFLCGLILIQESKSMGLGSSFGVDSGDSMFGVSTPDVLKKVTTWLAIIFCCGCLFLSFATNYLGKNFRAHVPSISEENLYEGQEPSQE